MILRHHATHPQLVALGCHLFFIWLHQQLESLIPSIYLLPIEGPTCWRNGEGILRVRGLTLLARRSLIHEEPLEPADAFRGRRGDAVGDPFGDSEAFVMLGPGPEPETARRRLGDDLGEGPSGADARCARADGTRFVVDIWPECFGCLTTCVWLR